MEIARIVDEAKNGWHTEIAARPLDPGAPARRVVELAAAVACAAVFFDVVAAAIVLGAVALWWTAVVFANAMVLGRLG